VFIEPDDALEAQTPGGHSEPGDAGTPSGGADGDDSDEDGEAEGAIDELHGELDRELEGEDDDEEDESEDYSPLGSTSYLSQPPNLQRVSPIKASEVPGGITDMKTI